MKPDWVSYMAILIPIVLVSFLVYPFWRRGKYESFANSELQMKTKVEFDGPPRWSKEELQTFEKAIANAKPRLESLQDEMFMILDDYKNVMEDLENTAYKQKQALDDIPKDIRKEEREQILKTSGLSSTPIKDFYDPLYIAKRNGMTPIAVRNEHDFTRTLPRVSVPPLGAFGKEDGLSWSNRGDTKERYDLEEEFYKSVPLYLPSFLASINEVLQNAEILRKNSGEASWGMRPRIERMEADIKRREKEAREIEEGFKNDEGMKCPKSIRIRTIKTISYKKWGRMAIEIDEKIREIRTLLNASIQDIQYSESFIQKMKKKGEQGKMRAQGAI